MKGHMHLAAGLDGEMFLGACIGLGLDPEGLRQRLAGLPVGAWQLRLETRQRGGISGVRAIIQVDDPGAIARVDDLPAAIGKAGWEGLEQVSALAMTTALCMGGVKLTPPLAARALLAIGAAVWAVHDLGLRSLTAEPFPPASVGPLMADLPPVLAAVLRSRWEEEGQAAHPPVAAHPGHAHGPAAHRHGVGEGQVHSVCLSPGSQEGEPHGHPHGEGDHGHDHSHVHCHGVGEEGQAGHAPPHETIHGHTHGILHGHTHCHDPAGTDGHSHVHSAFPAHGDGGHDHPPLPAHSHGHGDGGHDHPPLPAHSHGHGDGGHDGHPHVHAHPAVGHGHGHVPAASLAIPRISPVGAVILIYLVEQFTPFPLGGIQRLGYGLGDGEVAGEAHALRIAAWREAAAEPLAVQPVVLLAAHLDDMPPAWYPPMREALLTAGALAVELLPMTMKKGRPAVRLEVTAPQGREAELGALLLRHTTTIGVRLEPARLLRRGAP